MGTPHLGADIVRWGQVLAHIRNLVSIGSIKTDLLKDLKSKSKQYGEIAAYFVQTAAELQIVSMFECRPTKGAMVPSRSSLTWCCVNIVLDCEQGNSNPALAKRANNSYRL